MGLKNGRAIYSNFIIFTCRQSVNLAPRPQGLRREAHWSSYVIVNFYVEVSSREGCGTPIANQIATQFLVRIISHLDSNAVKQQ